MTELKLKSDTAKRKRFYTADSFSHPAKMHIGLQEWLLREFTEEGDVVLDPMAGSGSILIGTLMGRHIICVELEAKFVKMAEGNLKKINQLALYLDTKERGRATILQGDARDLTGLLADKILFSPPFKEQMSDTDWINKNHPRRYRGKHNPEEQSLDNIGNTNLPYGQIDKIVSSPPYAEANDANPSGVRRTSRQDLNAYSYLKTDTDGQIANLPYGDISAIISSPPYEASVADGKEGPGVTSLPGAWKDGTATKNSYTEHGEPVKVDHIISSPPYEGSGFGQSNKYSGNAVNLNQQVVSRNRPANIAPKQKPHQIRYADQIETNIGNLKNTSYLEAMLAVYQQCYVVLKPGGLLLLITKNFIRDKKEIRLDSDTIALCEQAGFLLKERHYRRLTQQSFWRTIALQKCDHRKGDKCQLGLSCPMPTTEQLVLFLLPLASGERRLAMRRIEKLCPRFVNTVPKLDKEDILVFVKQAETTPMN